MESEGNDGGRGEAGGGKRERRRRRRGGKSRLGERKEIREL